MDVRSLRIQNFYCLNFFVLGIFGSKTYLRAGEDDEKLLECLEVSDLSDYDNISDNDYEDFIEPDQDNVDEPVSDDHVSLADAELLFEDDSDDEPLSKLRKKLVQQKPANNSKHLLWKKMGTFVPPDVNYSGPEDTVYERQNWKIDDYISKYFEDSEFQNICNCTNVRYFQDKGKPMNLTVDEIKKFFGISIMMS